MKVLVTGHHGYIGSVLTPLVAAAGHDVTGLDSYFYRGCDLGPAVDWAPALDRDVRDVTAAELAGFDAVVHLAALSNDPIGDLNSATGPTTSTSTARSSSPVAPRRRGSADSCSRRRAPCTAPLRATRSSTRTRPSGR